MPLDEKVVLEVSTKVVRWYSRKVKSNTNERKAFQSARSVSLYIPGAPFQCIPERFGSIGNAILS